MQKMMELQLAHGWGPPGSPEVVDLPCGTVIGALTLAPTSATNYIGTSHTVTATLECQDSQGNKIPQPGVTIDFEIIGTNCNSGLTGSGVTDANGQATFTYTGTKVCTDTIQATCANVCDSTPPRLETTATKEWQIPPNQPPDCAKAYADPECLWPPNNQYPMKPVNILGVTDPDGDAVAITITGITSDEPTATIKGAGGPKAAPDASGVGTSQAMIRAERSGLKDGRVYVINFMADDGKGGMCNGSVVVNVPHDQSEPS
jgi:hypothetical protein